MSWTMKSANECWNCINLKKSVHMKLEKETLYTVWCSHNEVGTSEKCEHYKKEDKGK